MTHHSNQNSLLKGCIVFILFFVFAFPLKSENEPISQFAEAEKRMSRLAVQLTEIRSDDSLILQTNAKLIAEFENTLKLEGSFSYPFDSIRHIGKITSNDQLLRIFTWNIVKADGTHKQFGFIQYLFKPQKKTLLYELIDRSESIDKPQSKILTPENWFGATYYQVVETKGPNGTLYTLIGWDGNDLYSSKKIIDVLTFDDNGKPKFGEPIFSFEKNVVDRIVFEFSRMVTMMVRWDDDYQMIVMDHLAPNNPIYEGNPKYYGPDLSYDGLKFKNNLWEYVPTIDYKKASKSKLFGKKK
jgi:hypothetical protein